MLVEVHIISLFLGIALSELGRKEDAIIDYSMAIKNNP